MRVLGEFHSTIGGLVTRFDATVGFIEGDGILLFFNDPIEVPDAALRAVRLGCALRQEMARSSSRSACMRVEDAVEVQPVGEFMLKGFRRPVAAFNVVAIREPPAQLSHVPGEGRSSIPASKRAANT